MQKQIHKLKVLPKYFEDIRQMRKTFEVRLNDRQFQIGDSLLLCEWDGERYTLRHLYREVTYILSDFGGLQPGWVVLGIE